MLMFKREYNPSESGNAGLIVLIVLVVAAVGALAFFSGKLSDDSSKGTEVAEAVEAGAVQNAGSDEGNEAPPVVIKPGNPVVAKLGKDEVKRLEVFNFIQTLPDQTRQLPVEQLFPIALEQVINAKLISEKTQNVKLDKDPEVQKQLDIAKSNIVRNVYMQRQVEEKLTEERVRKAYEEYEANFPEIDEVKARHILVKEQKTAKEIIKKLNDGGDFAALAKEYSQDGTAENGGEIGYFAQADVVPEFAEAAFATEPGSYTQKPTQTDFGYHIIEVQEKRKRPPASFEDIKPFIEAQLRRQVLDEIIQAWRSEKDIERFDINGDAIEPASGG